MTYPQVWYHGINAARDITYYIASIIFVWNVLKLWRKRRG